MSNIKSINQISWQFLLLGFVFVAWRAHAQGPSGNTNIRSAVETRSYTFSARIASPLGGGMVQLMPGYTLKVRGDTLVCDLPYFGRVYNPTYGGDAGLKFTSTKFDYKTTPRKKGGWNIRIDTNDLNSNRRLYLSVFENGSASLNVNSNDRQTISYQGSVAGNR
jgi:hypothetical protein